MEHTLIAPTHPHIHTGCPDGVSLVSCFADPCEVSTCDEVGAECVANYCGGCNAFWFLEDREVCQEGAYIIHPRPVQTYIHI